MNVSQTGTYLLSYNHTDVAGNIGIPVTRMVNVVPVVSTGSTSSGSTGSGSTGTGSTGTGTTGSGTTGSGTTGSGTTGTGSTGTSSTGTGTTGTGIITSTSPTVPPNLSGPGGGGGGGGGGGNNTSSNTNSSNIGNTHIVLSSAPLSGALSSVSLENPRSAISGSIVPIHHLQPSISLSVQDTIRVNTEYKGSIDSLMTKIENHDMKPMEKLAQQYIYGTLIQIWRDMAQSSNPV